MQKLASFDIGIKNMAFCVFSGSGSQLAIEKWEILNLMDDVVQTTAPTCTCSLKTKVSKKAQGENSVVKMCGKKSKYTKNGGFFCEKHAGSQQEWLIPQREFSSPALKKLKYEELLVMATKYGVFGKIIFDKSTIPLTKRGLLEKTTGFFEEKSFNVLTTPKKKTAGETDLVSIGRNMTRLLDEIPLMTDHSITHVVLENQIGILANRMKTIQGMLAQYFIMRGRADIHVEFVSSGNKLKDFANSTKNAGSASQNYKQHKKDGITFCSQLMEANEWTYAKELWKATESVTKRDDLADCFLQGIWYLKRAKLITYAEDLKINSVSLS
jgi:hypothetical protein